MYILVYIYIYSPTIDNGTNGNWGFSPMHSRATYSMDDVSIGIIWMVVESPPETGKPVGNIISEQHI